MTSIFKRIIQILRQLKLILFYDYYCMHLPIESHSVLFLSDSREDLTGNFGFVYEAIKDDYKVYTALKGHHYSKKELARMIASAQFILVDDFYPAIYPLHIRKDAKLIQLWHALGAFKTVGYARRGNDDKYSLTHRNYTDAIVSSPSIVKDYARAFGIKEDSVHALGIPRTDIFFDDSYKDHIRKTLEEKYPIIKGKKVVLFAPTFRGNNIHSAYYDYDKIDFKKMQETLGEEYVCIIKMHPFIQNKPQTELDPQFFINLTHNREINDLLLITDVLITDYSSVIFEASLLHIPTIFFAYDLEDYVASRDFFHPYDHYTYGHVVKNQEELFEAILHPTCDEEKLTAFKKEFMSSCDGHSTQRVVETLLK